MVKRLLMVIGAMALIVSLVACDGGTPEEEAVVKPALQSLCPFWCMRRCSSAVCAPRPEI